MRVSTKENKHQDKDKVLDTVELVKQFIAVFLRSHLDSLTHSSENKYLFQYEKDFGCTYLYVQFFRSYEFLDTYQNLKYHHLNL